MFAGPFAPAGWALCNGQLLPISENDALFTLLGTTFGGDGESTFGLPNLQGRIPIHNGQGPALSARILGETGGVESVTLPLPQLPVHTHPIQGLTTRGDAKNPKGKVPAATPYLRYGTGSEPFPMNAIGMSVTGGSQPHNNLQPYLCVNFIISLFGVFPSQL